MLQVTRACKWQDGYQRRSLPLHANLSRHQSHGTGTALLILVDGTVAAHTAELRLQAVLPRPAMGETSFPSPRLRVFGAACWQ